jgi:cell division protein FtsN
MSNHDERGAYSPRNDEPLAFDARYPRGGERRPAPVALILSAAVLVLLAAAVFFYYRSGIRSEGQAPPVVGDPVGQMTSPPPASSQPADPAQGLEIYNTDRPPASEAPPTFAPAPEQPMLRPAAPAPSPAQAPAQAAAATQPAPLPAKPASPAPAAAAPAKPAPAKPAPAAAKPAPAPAAAKPEAAKPEAAKDAGGPAAVQIGAFSGRAQADKGWNDVARLLPGDMAGHGKRIEKADVGGATFHRTYVTGFASKAEAAAFCTKLKAAGKSCIVR